MTQGPLPHTIEFRSLAARGIVLEGQVEIEKMPRLKAAVHSAAAPAEVKAVFDRDEEKRYVVQIETEMAVELECQRCLEPMPYQLSNTTLIAAVWNDDQAKQLPGYLEPAVTADETDLWALVEDELLLALPAFSYHAEEDCGELVKQLKAEQPVVADEVEEKPNPFAVLASLKSSPEEK